MFRWVLPGQLARASRPGYGPGRPVSELEVGVWVDAARNGGIVSVLCLLAHDQLALYGGLPGGLLEYYRARGLPVAPVPVPDHQQPALRVDEEDRVWAAFRALPRPVLVHCSAGIDRTGQAVEVISRRLAEAGARA